MRIYGFNAPQERIEPKLWKSTQDFTHVNTGRFVRNAVLSGMCYGGNDLVPAFLKTCDAVHPLCGTEDFDGVAQSCYGALLDSVNNATTKAAIKSVCQPWNTSTVWAPGGTGVDAWLAVKLPEATLVERYVLVSTATTCPLSFKIQGSLDGSTWADLHTVENSGVWESSYTEKVFTIPEESRGTYLWYRLYVTASNAATMSIRNFRLWRAQSVCDRGQLRLDASAGSPLLLSFMNGFATDGVTPVDYDESLSAAIVQALDGFDSDGFPQLTGITTPVNIFATRSANGSVSISIENAIATESEYLGGGMNAMYERSFVAEPSPYPQYGYASAGYLAWGREGLNQNYQLSRLKKADNSPFYVSRLLLHDYNDWYTKIYVGEINGTETYYNITTSAQREIHLSRYINYVRNFGYRSNVGYCFSYGVRVFSLGSRYAYRMTNGKVYRRDKMDASGEWVSVQKIRLATAVYNGVDLYQLKPRSMLLSQWMTDGDAMSYLDA